jgi:hypothetical protein
MGATGSCHVRATTWIPVRSAIAATMARMIDRRLLGPGLAVALLLGACNAAVPSPRSEAPGPGATARASEAPGGPGQAGQTDTDWGRIWDTLPEAFPVFPGATAADDAAVEPASRTFVLDDADPRAVASWMQTELERAAYRTEALNGPFEDGSYILELVGDGECRIEVRVGPLGGLLAITVRYGAACPSP